MLDNHEYSIEKWLSRLPAPGETCVFSNEPYWKRDALLFDRVYAPVFGPKSADWTPPSIPINVSFGVTELEDRLAQDQMALGEAAFHGMSFVGSSSTAAQEILQQFNEVNDVSYERNVTRGYWSLGAMGSWSFGERGRYLRRFSEGECVAYQGALHNLPLVVDKDVSWNEILEFRYDKEAVRKYRDLRIWLSEGLKATSPEHAADIIGQKIDNYRWAIKKHGLKTKLGAVTQLFQWKESSLAVAAGGAIGALSGPVFGAIAGGLVALGQIGIYLTQQNIDHKEVLRGTDREVAILYEAQEKFGSPETEPSRR